MSAKQSKAFDPSKGDKITLQDRHKVFICQCWAEFKGFPETIDAFLLTFKTDMDAEDVFDETAFRDWLYGRINYYWNDPKAHKWQTLAKQLRQKWIDGTADLILAHKRARIEELQNEYFKITDEYTDKVLKSVDGEIKVKRRNTGAKVQTLEQIRKELEGEKVNISGTLTEINIDYDKLTDDQLRRIESGEHPLCVVQNHAVVSPTSGDPTQGEPNESEADAKGTESQPDEGEPDEDLSLLRE